MLFDITKWEDGTNFKGVTIEPVHAFADGYEKPYLTFHVPVVKGEHGSITLRDGDRYYKIMHYGRSSHFYVVYRDDKIIKEND